MMQSSSRNLPSHATTPTCGHCESTSSTTASGPVIMSWNSSLSTVAALRDTVASMVDAEMSWLNSARSSVDNSVLAIFTSLGNIHDLLRAPFDHDEHSVLVRAAPSEGLHVLGN